MKLETLVQPKTSIVQCHMYVQDLNTVLSYMNASYILDCAPEIHLKNSFFKMSIKGFDIDTLDYVFLC